jgi:hypothetical protein
VVAVEQGGLDAGAVDLVVGKVGEDVAELGTVVSCNRASTKAQTVASNSSLIENN